MVAGVSSSSPDHLLGADSGSGQDQDVGFGSSEVDPVDTISKHNRLLNAADVPEENRWFLACLLYTSPSPRDGLLSRMPSSA